MVNHVVISRHMLVPGGKVRALDISKRTVLKSNLLNSMPVQCIKMLDRGGLSTIYGLWKWIFQQNYRKNDWLLRILLTDSLHLGKQSCEFGIFLMESHLAEIKEKNIFTGFSFEKYNFLLNIYRSLKMNICISNMYFLHIILLD